MPTLTREPSLAVKQLLTKLVDATGVASNPQDALDASINHLGVNLAIIAQMQHKSRGELKRMARSAFEDCLAMALANHGAAK